MKRIFSALFVLFMTVPMLAQHNHRTGYFLDGYTYKYKINPAFGSDRGYLAIPVAGFSSLAVESPLQLSSLLYPTGNDGELVTFLSPTVSAQDVMSRVNKMNPININADISVFSLGFNAGKSFHTLDISLKADARVNVPGALFSWVKESADVLDMSKLGLNADARVELSYGYSRSILYDKARFGARVKMLAGLAKANYSMDKLKLTPSQDAWTVESAGNGYLAAPLSLMTDGPDQRISGIEVPEYEALLENVMADRNLGAAIDLGFTIDLVKYLTVSASITDLGFMSWNNAYILGSPDEPWSYDGFEGIGNEELDLGEQFGVMGEELLDLVYPRVISEATKKVEMLAMTAHLGVEFRMPFWQRLSVGALGSARFDGPYSWYEGRASINCALFRFFSFSGSYAYSNFGESYGAAVNFHPNGLNLFVGVDSFKPLLNMTRQYVPIDSFNTNLTFGLDIAFGKYKGRYPKKAKN